MGNRFQRTLSSPDAIGERLPLVPWLYRVIGISKIRIQVRFRGNALYILCESSSCPSRSIVLDQLLAALAKTNLDDLLPENQASIYQLIVYGRVAGEKHPHWAEVIHVAQIDQYLALDEVETEHVPLNPSTIALTNLRLAREGKPEAIARYLSEELTSLGISVQASVRSLVLSEDVGLPQTANLASVFTSSAALTPQAFLNRLWIVCESAYSPELGFMAELIPQKLRDLELQGFRDALVLSRVQGEAEPEWILRVDLTPPNEMLKDWARWGDVEALLRLIQRSLRDQAIEVSATLMETTLHLTCHHLNAPDKESVLATIVPLLETVAPQGIHAAVAYGLEGAADSTTPYLSIPETPVWVQWVNLPAAEHAALADSTDQLAKQGDLAAIAFLLTRLLNPDLDIQLATGGTQIQVRQKEDLLHIMTDAPICPLQNQVGVLVANMIKALELPSVQGVRVYGRRAGQKRPLWSYGVDFTLRDRLVPEATPEFAASDAYVGDLLTTMPSELAARSQDPGEIDSLWERWLEAMQTGIARSRLFVVEAPTAGLTGARPVQTPGAHHRKVALICGVLGILLTVQTDLGLGQILQSTTKSTAKPSALPSPSEALPLPQLPLQRSGGAKTGSIFNALGFTQSGQTVIAPTTASKDGAAKSLVASPLKPKAAVDTSRSPYPTFNATQLDEKLVLYRQFVAQSGAPDVLIVGSSRAMRGIDPAVLEQALATQGYPGLKVFNFGVNGATAQVVDLIVRRILPAEKMPKLVIFADGLRAFNSGRTDVTYNVIASSPGFGKLPDAATASEPESPFALTKPIETIARTNTIVSDSYKSFNTQLLDQLSTLSAIYDQRAQLQTALVKSLTAGWSMETLSEGDAEEGIPQDGQGLIDIQGFLPISNRFNPVTYYQKYARIPGENDGDYADFNLEGVQTEALRNMATFLRSQNIPLVVLNLPLTEQYLDPFRREREKQFQEYLLRTSTELGFTYRDLLDNWLSTPDFFSDPSHLNRYGSYAVSQHIAKDALIPWKKR